MKKIVITFLIVWTLALVDFMYSSRDVVPATLHMEIIQNGHVVERYTYVQTMADWKMGRGNAGKWQIQYRFPFPPKVDYKCTAGEWRGYLWTPDIFAWMN